MARARSQVDLDGSPRLWHRGTCGSLSACWGGGAAGPRVPAVWAGMKTCRIAVVGGDGIGPEVVGGALDVLLAARRAVSGFDVEPIEAPAGAACYLERGAALPAESLAACRAADAILLGACGL